MATGTERLEVAWLRSKRHGFSVDVEDFGALVGQRYFAGAEVAPWRVVHDTSRLEKLLADYEVRATFFFLGSVVERSPDLVRLIYDGGHEIGSHGYSHQPCNTLSARAFREDVGRSLDAIRRVLPNSDIDGYRAPFFSLTDATPWVPAILQDLGIRYSSSVYPARTANYGWIDAPRRPFFHECGLAEIPVTTLELLGRCWPIGGGGYLRMLPSAMARHALTRAAGELGHLVLYVHPHELFDLPPVSTHSVPWRERIRYRIFHAKQGVRRSNFAQRLKEVFDSWEFGPLGHLWREMTPHRYHGNSSGTHHVQEPH